MAINDLIKIPTVQAFLMDGTVMTVFEAILEKFALPKDRAVELLDLTDAVLDEELAIVDIPQLIAQAFAVEEARAVRIACDVVGFRLLPLAEYVPNVAEQIVAWGGNLEKYPKSRVGKMKMSPETFAASIDERLQFGFSEVLVKRCGFLLGAYWRGEKTKESTLTFFSRATTIGGLGLSPEDAQRLLTAIDDERAMVELVGGDAPVTNSGEDAVAELEKGLVESTDDAQESVAPMAREETALEISPSHEVAAEIPVVNAPSVPKRPYTEESHPELAASAKSAARLRNADRSPDAIEEAVRAAIDSALGMLSANSISETVFADIVRKALKGVRDLNQTRDVLSRDLKFSGEILEKMMTIVESAYKQVHAGSAITNVPNPRAQLRTTEHTTPSLLDQRFATIAQDNPGETQQEVLPGSRVSVARTVDEEQRQQIAGLSEEKLAQAAIASRPTPVKPMLTVGSVPPKGRETTLTDVQPVRRMMGPVEELGNMTPQEFRRLSTTPVDAAAKVEDILAALQTQSYEDRVRGIQAWRQSPMNQLYATMTAESLEQGIALAEVAGKRRSAGEESLSPAEIRAIAALNERLRF